MPQIPNDPVMLLSFVNTQLRDQHASLAELCASYAIEESVITEKLLSIGYAYDKNANRFQ